MTSREIALETFKESQIPNTPYNWHLWKRAFDLGYREGQKNAKELGLYCQRYCGCILSLKERIEEIKQII